MNAFSFARHYRSQSYTLIIIIIIPRVKKQNKKTKTNNNNNNNNNTNIFKVHIVCIRAESEAPAVAWWREWIVVVVLPNR